MQLLLLTSPSCPQPVRPPPHGGADLIGDEVSGISELCAPRPGHQELLGGPPPHHQDRRLWDEQEPVQQRLLPHPGPSGAAHPMDGLGEHPAGEDTAAAALTASLDLFLYLYSVDILNSETENRLVGKHEAVRDQVSPHLQDLNPSKICVYYCIIILCVSFE